MDNEKKLCERLEQFSCDCKCNCNQTLSDVGSLFDPLETIAEPVKIWQREALEAKNEEMKRILAEASKLTELKTTNLDYDPLWILGEADTFTAEKKRIGQKHRTSEERFSGDDCPTCDSLDLIVAEPKPKIKIDLGIHNSNVAINFNGPITINVNCKN